MKKHFHMTDKEIRIRWENRGLPDFQMMRCLAELNGVDRDTMADKLEELGLYDRTAVRRTKDYRSYSDKEHQIIKTMLVNGKTYAQIGARLQRTVDSVAGEIHRMRVRGEFA